MKKSSLIYYDNPILRQQCSPVEVFDDHVKDIAANILEIMHKHNGIGLTAAHIGHLLAIIVLHVPVKINNAWVHGKVQYFVNPTLKNFSRETEIDQEGSLSFPSIYVPIARPKTITVEAYDLEGAPFSTHLEGLEARCFLHEYDQVNGIAFIHKTSEEEKKRIQPMLVDIDRKYNKK